MPPELATQDPASPSSPSTQQEAQPRASVHSSHGNSRRGGSCLLQTSELSLRDARETQMKSRRTAGTGPRVHGLAGVQLWLTPARCMPWSPG